MARKEVEAIVCYEDHNWEYQAVQIEYDPELALEEVQHRVTAAVRKQPNRTYAKVVHVGVYWIEPDEDDVFELTAAAVAAEWDIPTDWRCSGCGEHDCPGCDGLPGNLSDCLPRDDMDAADSLSR